MLRRTLLALASLLPGGALSAADLIPPAVPSKPEKEKSEWVFSILPKSLQKNPLLDITVITEMTEAGKKRPTPTAKNPAYFETFSAGFKQLGDAPGNEKTLAAEDIDKLLVRAMAANSYLPAKKPEHPPSLLIIYTWGSHNRKEEADAENPALSGAAIAANILDRAAMVGGKKFADELLRLFEQADAMSIGQNARVPPGGEAVFTPEMMEFANPVTMFRRASIRNEVLLDQTANDIYYVVASAYDYESAATNRRVLLWRTRMTVGSPGTELEFAL